MGRKRTGQPNEQERVEHDWTHLFFLVLVKTLYREQVKRSSSPRVRRRGGVQEASQEHGLTCVDSSSRQAPKENGSRYACTGPSRSTAMFGVFGGQVNAATMKCGYLLHVNAHLLEREHASIASRDRRPLAGKRCNPYEHM